MTDPTRHAGAEPTRRPGCVVQRCGEIARMLSGDPDAARAGDAAVAALVVRGLPPSPPVRYVAVRTTEDGTGVCALGFFGSEDAGKAVAEAEGWPGVLVVPYQALVPFQRPP